jgi:hypothetical protein
MKQIISTILISFFCSIAFAQDHHDALNLSKHNLNGSARVSALSNAFGALGGDFNSLSMNPAGIGVFRTSEFSFAPELQSNYSSSEHYGYKANNFRVSLNNNQIGYVGVIKTQNTLTGWLNFNIGFGVNKVNDFNNKTLVSGYNNQSSLVDTYVNNLNRYSADILETINDDPAFYQGSNLAWQNYLINVDTTPNIPFYRTFAIDSNLQSNTIIERGKTNETLLSFGGNHSNKLYVGATIGSPKINYKKNSIYSETASLEDTLTLFESFNLNESLHTVGRGYNAKFGVIYKPTNTLRLGISYHTPTFYQLTDKWNTSMTSIFSDAEYTYDDPEGTYKYGLITPYKLSLSAANTFGKYGLLSFETDIVDYTSMQYISLDDSYSFINENNAIDTSYTTTFDLKFGAEIRLDHYTIRGGYAHLQDANKNGTNHTSNYSIGAGYRDEGFYFDVAYSFSTKQNSLDLYTIEGMQSSQIKNNKHRVTTTIGIRF